MLLTNEISGNQLSYYWLVTDIFQRKLRLKPGIIGKSRIPMRVVYIYGKLESLNHTVMIG